MIPIAKSEQDINFYLTNGPKFGKIINYIATKVEDGQIINAQEIDKEFKLRTKATFNKIKYPFYNVSNSLEKFGAAVCVSVNNIVAHGKPLKKIKFNTGDIISIDFGLAIKHGKGYLHFDSAVTVQYKELRDPWIYSPLNALRKITRLTGGLTTKDISKTIQEQALNDNLRIVTSLTGHGIGYNLHESPYIHNATGSFSETELFNGLCFCAEPIFTKQRGDSNISRVYVDSDYWSVRTDDGYPSSHFETMFYFDGKKITDLTKLTELNKEKKR